LGLIMSIAAEPRSAEADTMGERIALLEPAMSVSLPDGAGPFPVVIMLHGCGGRQQFINTYAQILNRAGVATVIVDSFKPRRINMLMAYGTVCTGLQMWGRQRAGDLYAVMAWARAQAWADPHKLYAAGWSHGGWTIIDALALRSGAEMRRATGLTDLPEEPLMGLAGCFLAYPYAGRASFAGRRAWRFTPRTIAIIGGRDYIVGTDVPRTAMERIRGANGPIEIEFFPNATHAFDVPEALDARIRFNAEDTARAQDLLLGLVSGGAPCGLVSASSSTAH
jgi:dienelactone hydrolase